MEKELILAVEKHNADLPKDENYVDECLNYKDSTEVKEMVLDDLRETLAENGRRESIDLWIMETSITTFLLWDRIRKTN